MQRYNIAKEGLSWVLGGFILYITIFILNWLEGALMVLVVLFFIAYFFREPERQVVFQGHSVISPGEGRIVRIGTRMEEEFLKEKMQCISIFLSVFDVHVNYSPFDGVVEDVVYEKGKFLNAMNDKSSLENEHVTILLSTEKGKIVVRQIAGLIARRVICSAVKGTRLKKGRRYGIIKFGSRVDIFLPMDFKITVNVGDKAIAGLTELAITG